MLSSHDMISHILHAAAQGKQAAAAAGSRMQVSTQAPESKSHVEPPAYELVGTWVQQQAQQAGALCEKVARLFRDTRTAGIFKIYSL
jgi:hypothetical protein